MQCGYKIQKREEQEEHEREIADAKIKSLEDEVGNLKNALTKKNKRIVDQFT